MFHLTYFSVIFLFSMQIRAESVHCVEKENNSVLDAPQEIYEIDISNEKGILDVSINLDKKIEALELIAIVVRREVDGQENFTARLFVYSDEDEERNTAFMSDIPDTEIDQYSFIITYQQKYVQCAPFKQFKIPIIYKSHR